LAQGHVFQVTDHTSAFQRTARAMFYVFRVALLAAVVLSMSPIAVAVEADVAAEADGKEDASQTDDDGADVADDAEDGDGMDGKDDELMPEILMKELDKDSDGFLSLAELTGVEMDDKHKKLMENAFNTADADKDGKLSAAELPVAMNEFESLSEAGGEDGENHQDDDHMEGKDDELSSDENDQDDDDTDGKDDELSSDENDQDDDDTDGKDDLLSSHENHKDDGGMDGKDGELSPDDIMREADKDKDGFLSLVELMDDEMDDKHKKLIEKSFNTADADKDGKLSAAELPVAIKEFESLSMSLAEGKGGQDL